MNETCPICGKAVARDAALQPFCSDRCRRIDLGRWLAERYRVPEAAPARGEEIPPHPVAVPDED